MQEEVENRTLTLVSQRNKVYRRLFKAAITKYLPTARKKQAAKVRKAGNPREFPRQTDGKQLIGQNQGVFQHRDHRPSIKEFEKMPGNTALTYAVKKDRSSPAQVPDFFKAGADALTAALPIHRQEGQKGAENERPSGWQAEQFKGW